MSLVSFVPIDTIAEQALSIGWDGLKPGTQVQGLTEKPMAGSVSAESRIYVCNSSCVSSPNCLAYDFSDFPKGKNRGYPMLHFPSVTNGWSVFSLCFKRESGSVSGEIRGYYDLPGVGALGKKRDWPFLWFSFNDMFSIKVEGQMRWQVVRVGQILPNVWHRVQIAIPPPGEAVSQTDEFILLTTEAKWYRNDHMTGKGVPELESAAASGDEFLVDYVRVYDIEETE